MLLIDGNYVLYRSFFAIRALYTDEKQPINAVYGFFSTLLKLMALPVTTHLVITFDKGRPDFRHQQLPEYKAHRPKMPDELFSQLEIIQDILAQAKFPFYMKPGFEADDLIATLARNLTKNSTDQVLIFSGDMDLGQLLNDQIHLILYEKGQNKLPVIIDSEAFTRRWHVAPHLVVDYKILAGDPSDNIAGIPGIGKISAQKLLAKYGSLDQIYLHIDEIQGALQKKLRAGQDLIVPLKQVVSLVSDVDFSFDRKASALESIDLKALIAAFESYRFRTLQKRAEELHIKLHQSGKIDTARVDAEDGNSPEVLGGSEQLSLFL